MVPGLGATCRKVGAFSRPGPGLHVIHVSHVTGASPQRVLRNQGFRRSEAVLVDRTGCRSRRWARQCIAVAGYCGVAGGGRRSGSMKRVAFDGAAGVGDPGASFRGGESNPVNPREGARQRASEAGSRPSLPAENAGKRERCSESLDQGSSGPSGAWFLGKPGRSQTHAEAGGSPSSEAPLDHAPCQGFGRAGFVEAAITCESGWRW